MGTLLRLYGSDKTVLGLLPEHTGLTTQVALNAPGTLICDYPLSGVNAGLLDADVAYLAVIEDGAESPDWFLLDDDTDDPAAAEGEARPLRLAARGLLALLEHAQVYPIGHTPGGSVDGLDPKHDFNDATPGTILKTLLNRAKARGCFPDLTFTFTDTVDSSGNAWPTKYDVSYAAGTNYLTLAQTMAENGWVDLRMSGFELEVFAPNTTMNADKTGSVILRLNQQVQEGPRKRSRRGIISHLLGIGAEKNMVEVASAGTATKYGRREGNASDGRMTTNGSLSHLAQEALNQHLNVKEGFTLKLSLDAPPDESWPRPGYHYKVGDRIAYDQRRMPSGALEALRVRTITWSWATSTEAPSCSLELNDLFVEATLRLQRKVNGLLNSSVLDSGEPPVDPVEVDTTIPKAPGTITLTTYVYPSGNTWLAGVDASWAAVTRNMDESDYIDHAQYVVEYSFNGETWIRVPAVQDSQATIEGLPTGRPFTLRVAAQDTSGHLSGDSTSVQITTASDGTPPPPASVLVAKTRLGVVTLTWDGNDELGGAMPSDFDHLAVYRSSDPAVVAPAGTFVDNITTPGGYLIVTDLPYNVAQHFTAVSVDAVGNVSGPSVAVTVTTQPLVDIDLVGQVVGASNIMDGAVTDLALADDAVTNRNMSPGAVELDNLGTTATGAIDQARTDAIAAAATDAAAKADAAQQAAIDAAALDATAKAETAEANAAATAAADAQAKADAAQQAAIDAAAVTAQLKADGAEQSAIDAAALDAQAKADAAQQAAIDAAALDATAKAETAEANAAATAAADAQAKADAAEQAAIDAAAAYAQSRGTDLVTNGTGFYGDNTNFSWSTFDPTDAPVGANGSFTSATNGTRFSDEFIPIDTNKRYIQSVQARQQVPGVVSRAYVGLAPNDAQKQGISPQHYVYHPDTMTTLAAPLNPGDTTVTLTAVPATDAWTKTPTYKIIGFWDWKDPAGRVWPKATYTRNVMDFASISGNVVTLAAAYAGPALPAGNPVSRNWPGGNYMYTVMSNVAVPETWTRYRSAVIGGIANGARTDPWGPVTEFPPGCAFVRLLFLDNYQGANGGRQAFASVSISDAAAAQVTAEAAAADAITKSNEAKDAAIAAAAADATAKAEQAEANAAATAAADATAKADAAQQAAIDAAAVTAQLKADGAEQSAIDAAALDAQTKADAAQQAAIDAAALDATAKAEQAEADAAATAALDATAKADQAKADAIAAAATDAQAKADAAQQAAIDAAALDAQAKADAAEAAATAAAATDAQTKADAAQQAAIDAAAVTAQLKADGAEQSAIDAAALDAQAKADAAEQAAKDAAALDAQAKADAAEAAATAAAAADAQTKADAAQQAAQDAMTDYVQARGTDLVTNGTGFLGDNTNFSQFTFTGADAPAGAGGSFLTPTGSNTTRTIDELIPYVPSKKYLLSTMLRQTVAGRETATAYTGLAPYDGAKMLIAPVNYMYEPNTLTTLAQALNPGDTVIHLTSAANWRGSTAKPAGANGNQRTIIWWDYTDSFGKKWPELTYSRNFFGYDKWADGGVDTTTNTITLRAPYDGPAKAAGTKLSNGSSGGTYVYGGAANSAIPATWTTYKETITGTVSTGQNATFATGMPAGTAFVSIVLLPNRTTPSPYRDDLSRHAWANIQFSDAAGAQVTADAAQAAADAARTAADAAQVAADAAAIATGASSNPTFSRWAAGSTYPTDFTSYGSVVPKRETVLVRTKPNALRFTGPDAATESGAYGNSVALLKDLPLGLGYVTIEADVMVASGTFAGAGILLDWNGMGGTNRGVVDFAQAIPGPKTGQWYRVTKVLPRPAGATGTQTGWATWIMGNYAGSGFVKSQKDILFDRVQYRASTDEEINAFNMQASIDTAVTASANGKNSVTYSEVPPSGSGSVAGDTWFQRVAATGVVSGQWEWDGDSWNEQTLDSAVLASVDVGKLTGGQIDAQHIRVGSASTFDAGYDPSEANGLTSKWVKTGTTTIDGGEIAADTVTATQLAAGSVTAEKLTVGSIGDSVVLNGGFEEVSTDPATSGQPARWNGVGLTWDAATPIAGARSLGLAVVAAGGASASVKSDAFPVAEGDRWFVRLKARDSGGTSPGFLIRLVGGALPTDTNVVTLSEQSPGITVPTAATPYGVQGAIPAGWKYASVELFNDGAASTSAHTIYVDDVEARKVVVSAAIADGAIIAGKIGVDAVTANTIAANAVTAVKIEAGAVTAVKIDANAVTADKIEAGAVTAGKLDADAVTAANIAAGAIDGQLITGAHIRTAAANLRWELSQANSAVIQGFTGAAEEGAPGGVLVSLEDDFMVATLQSAADATAGATSGRASFTAKTRRSVNYDQAYGSMAVITADVLTVEPTGTADARIQMKGMRTLARKETAGKTVATSTYTPTAAVVANCGFYFIAPESGTVKVEIAALMRSTVAGQYCKVDFEIRNGTTIGGGTFFRNADTGVTSCHLSTVSTEFTRNSGLDLIAGLTPGAAYNIYPVMAGHSGQSCSVAGTTLMVTPSL